MGLGFGLGPGLVLGGVDLRESVAVLAEGPLEDDATHLVGVRVRDRVRVRVRAGVRVR